MQTANHTNRLRELRRAKGMELYDVAGIVRKSAAMISRYERGQSEPPLPIVRQLAALYGVSVEYAMGWSDERNPQEAAA